MNDSPLVSICIPVFNCKNYIERTLQSVFNQTYINFEAIIQDNSSNDGTRELIEQLLRSMNDPRFKLFQTSNKLSMLDNWNGVLRRANGKYTKLLCADDTIDPDCLKRQIEILENPLNSEVVLTSCKRRIIDTNDTIYLSGWGLSQKARTVSNIQVLKRCILFSTNIIGEPCAVLFRTNAYPKETGFQSNNSYLIDMDLWTTLLKSGSAYLDNQVLCSFRIYSTSGTGKAGTQQISQSLDYFKNTYFRQKGSINIAYFLVGRVLGRALGFLRVLFILALSIQPPRIKDHLSEYKKP